ncbi:hypothetical protein N7474_004865 [Penicillium riverlandense]|uniref:uncharacterized protein n=1 Tax=Penicillium riverlandense TaxID=1903569 RepID=UPI00254780C8|nr:uncharacterized protein N7474_004865 [Penicillium riverlandense]KAJ5819274.1 hypothetical protein N7474_004865 [Penicillium riverlandense]
MDKPGTVDGRVKKRAGRACALCRSRKVRCDVGVHRPSKQAPVSKASKSNAPAGPLPGGDGRSAPEIISQQAGQHEDHTILENQTPGPATGCHVGLAEERLAPSHSTIDLLKDIACPNLPSFIIPLPASLDQADLRYLFEKNAFSLPTGTFRDVCLARYLEFTHPLLPLLDKAQVVSILDNETRGKRPMALLLFHAVMCAGVTFVENEIIKREGFDSKQSARRAFFNRAKELIFRQVLFDCNTEPNTFVAVQTAILMSTWYPGKEKKDPWYWAGTALSLAYSIGLHLEPDKSRFDTTEQHLRRRVWWCTFAREQKNALALGRPARTTYCGVSMLAPEDFDDEINVPAAVHLPEVTQSLSVLEDRPIQDALAGLCIEHMKLCVSIALFLSTTFKIRQQVEGSNREDYNEYPTPSPSSRLDYCAQEFARWYREMPPNLHYEAHAATSNPYNTQHGRSLIVHKATVHVVYYVAVSALYRLKALSPSSTWCNRQDELQGSSQRVLRHAAWELTSVNWGLYQAGLSPYLSTTAVGSVAAAILIHLLDTKSPDETVKCAAVQGIQQCKQFLLSLRGAYGTEVEALDYLRAAERHDADLSVSEEQQTAQMRHVVAQSPKDFQQQLRDPGVEPMLMRPWNSPPTAAEIQDACGFESSSLTGTDKMFWQSCFEGAPNYDLFDFSLPHYDQMVSSNGVEGFNMARMFAES